MKETGDSNAPYFGLPEGLNRVRPHAPAYYGNQYVPKPCNKRAEMVNPPEVMQAVLEGK